MRALALVALLMAIGSPVCGHEIGTTQVRATFLRDHTYQIDVATGPLSLLSKIEHRRVTISPEGARARLRMHAPELQAAAEVYFGSQRVTPAVEILPDDTVRFHGEIPQGAGPFRWRYHLVYSYYPLAIGEQRQWLDGDTLSSPVPLSRDVVPPTRVEVARQYLLLGYTHIVPYGLDHILFVLGIFLLSSRVRPILMQVTSFTVAHSITLGLSMYGVLSVSPRIVEPMIAVSIAYVAIENIFAREVSAARVFVVFAFGLLHGLGFAGVLRELGLPRAQFATALLTFNLGVEGGQLTVIAAAFLLVAAWHRQKPWYRERFVVPASAVIAATGIFWTVQRVFFT